MEALKPKSTTRHENGHRDHSDLKAISVILDQNVHGFKDYESPVNYSVMKNVAGEGLDGKNYANIYGENKKFKIVSQF